VETFSGEAFQTQISDIHHTTDRHSTAEPASGATARITQSAGKAGFVKRDRGRRTWPDLGLVLLLPFLAIVALAIRVTDGGGVFYRQIRVGLDRRRFTHHQIPHDGGRRRT
jgi:lipopolysaccharide/colanic/teichoic acid biosynthesis glycosyltransferase